MRYWLITSVIKCQILASNDLTIMSKCRTRDLEPTILKSRGLMILHRLSKFYTHWQYSKILLVIITTTIYSLKCIRKGIALEQDT